MDDAALGSASSPATCQQPATLPCVVMRFHMWSLLDGPRSRSLGAKEVATWRVFLHSGFGRHQQTLRVHKFGPQLAPPVAARPRIPSRHSLDCKLARITTADSLRRTTGGPRDSLARSATHVAALLLNARKVFAETQKGPRRRGRLRSVLELQLAPPPFHSNTWIFVHRIANESETLSLIFCPKFFAPPLLILFCLGTYRTVTQQRLDAERCTYFAIAIAMK